MYLKKPNKFLKWQKNPPIGRENEINRLDNAVNQLMKAANRVKIGFKRVGKAFPRGQRRDNWVSNVSSM